MAYEVTGRANLTTGSFTRDKAHEANTTLHLQAEKELRLQTNQMQGMHTHTYTHTCVYPFIFHTHAQICGCIYVYVCVYIHIHKPMCMCSYVHVLCTYVCLYVYSYMCTCIYTYIYTCAVVFTYIYIILIYVSPTVQFPTWNCFGTLDLHGEWLGCSSCWPSDVKRCCLAAGNFNAAECEHAGSPGEESIALHGCCRPKQRCVSIARRPTSLE